MQNENAQKVTEPDFRKKKCRKYAGKTGFLSFSRDFIISFFWFFAQRCILANVQNMTESDFWENFFSGWKYRKYAGNRRFCRFSSDLYLIFRCFFTQNIKDYRKSPFLQIFIWLFSFVFLRPYTFLILLPFLFPFYIYH